MWKETNQIQIENGQILKFYANTADIPHFTFSLLI